MKYYSLTKINNTKSDYNLIIGQRSNGKTYAVCKFMLQQYKKTGRKFAYVRRWADDIKGYRCEQLFLPLQAEIERLFGKGYTITYYRHKFFLTDPDGKKQFILGYSLALSEASHTKSVSYGTDLKYILFDEFIQMAGERTLADEKAKFENTLSTLIRDKQDVVIYMLANTVSKFSPYFIYFGIDINKVSQGSIITKEIPTDDDKGILRVSLEYCEYNKEIGKRAGKYTASKMIKTGQWEIAPVDDIPTVKGEKVNDRLVCTFHDPEADINIGCFLRRSIWSELIVDPTINIFKTVNHVREFLILKEVERRSRYFHLTMDKALDYHTYNDLGYFLKDIKDNTEIDIEHELFMGRIFCDNMFTADYFNHIWKHYSGIKVRDML